jgi:hypothetical protein
LAKHGVMETHRPRMIERNNRIVSGRAAIAVTV